MNDPIASVARPPGVEYLTKSLHRVIESLDESELVEVVIVVALTDREKRLRDERGKILYRKFRSEVDSGLVIIVGPTSNIYPMTNFYALKRRPFNNTYCAHHMFSRILNLLFVQLFLEVTMSNLFVTSKINFSNSPIHEFKVRIRENM